MAVSAGEYTLAVSVDLSPVFGVVRQEAKVSVTVPGPDALKQRLTQLRSEDPTVRRTALLDLRYFTGEGAEVVPALLGLLDDADATTRMLALSVLGSFPAEAAPHVDRFLAILTAESGVSENERANAAWLAARVAPESDRVRAALERLVAKAEATVKTRYEAALRMYERRFAAR